MSEAGRTLLLGGVVYSHSDPFATALLIDDGRIAWVGDDSGAQVHLDIADQVVHLDGAFVAPGFVDSHIHATSTGLVLTALDLSQVRSASDLLDAVHAHAKDVRGGLVYGHGWDETTWSDRELPTRAELDRAAWGSEVYLARVDVHSALISSALVARVRAITEQAGYSADGPVQQIAHEMARTAALERLSSASRERAQQATLHAALANGIVAVHEMAGPSIGGAQDARALRELADAGRLPKVSVYWGEVASEEAFDTARAIGAHGLGGDLFVDGSLGSRTAALIEPYADAETNGRQYLSEELIAEHLRSTTKAGVPGGFHVIGDAACRDVAAAFRAVAQDLGADRVRAAGHRIEHAEMLATEDIASLASLGVTFSMQPVFDAWWGLPGGMYDQRLGVDRAHGMNAFAEIVAAGGQLTINSDSPVTPLRPWTAVRAAIEHTNPELGVSGRAAFNAHTRAGWRAVGQPEIGTIAPGAPAHLAIWRVADLQVRVPDERVQGWSTDPRAATPGLPDLDSGDPQCLATLMAGQCAYGHEYWESRRAG